MRCQQGPLILLLFAFVAFPILLTAFVVRGLVAILPAILMSVMLLFTLTTNGRRLELRDLWSRCR